MFKTVKRAFIEWKDVGSNSITKTKFTQLMEAWGFRKECPELFEWLDSDHDGTISFSDLRISLGSELTPMEQFFFR